MRYASLLRRPAALFAALFALAALIGAAAFYASPAAASYLKNFSQDWALGECAKEERGDLQIECLFRLMDIEMKSEGVESTMEIFHKAYQRFPEFVGGGCHHQAHRVGDLAYYGLYIGNEDLDAIDFSQSTTACGYGFYHGFMEHLIQDHPTPEFVDQTCTYLTEKLGETMGDIRLTCYHGAGHGFILAQIETLTAEEWNVENFSQEPAKWCMQLKKANATDKQQCIEGVYNVIADSMSSELYGLAYDYEHPFSVCDRVPRYQRQACYYEMAQKLDKPSGLNPQKLAELSSQAVTPELDILAFRVGIAGIVQQVIAQEGGYQTLLTGCGALPTEHFDACVGSVVNGLYEHGSPQEEYKKALEACTHPVMTERRYEKTCYQTVALRLPRFYSDAQITGICAAFPEPYRGLCEGQIGKREAGPMRTVQE